MGGVGEIRANEFVTSRRDKERQWDERIEKGTLVTGPGDISQPQGASKMTKTRARGAWWLSP